MTRSRRIAILKPDYGVVGGVELVVDRIELMLRAQGHDVTRVPVMMNALPHRPFGLAVPDDAWDLQPEYFRYLAGVEAFERLDTSAFDAVISTQPPSWSNRHPRHANVFFHHHRIYYDLCEPYLAAGFAEDPELHRRAAQLMRVIDNPRLAEVQAFAPISEETCARLRRFNGVTNTSVWHPGAALHPLAASGPTADADPGDGPVLCVTRHEFPKRAELFVHAMKYLPELRATVVGGGGRLAWVRWVDSRLSTDGVDLDAVSDRELWLNTGQGAGAPSDHTRSNVDVVGRVDDATLDQLYRTASCVVAPAFDEDYGLTAIEAMTYGRPVVVCDDGGGLTDLVDDGITGVVVPPTGRAIADAVQDLVADPERRRSMGEAGLAQAASFTWERAAAELHDAIGEVLA